MFSRNSVLENIVREVTQSLDPLSIGKRRINVFFGVHRMARADYLVRGLKIGFQTEQFFDAKGRALWGAHKRGAARSVLFALERLDLLVDFSDCNSPFYSEISRRNRAKLVFGPHIFPECPPVYSEPKLETAVFFGDTTGQRRISVISPMEKDGLCHVIERGVFGSELDDRISPHSAVLNVHYDEGIYTEFPRILTAVRNGKPVLSEKLAPGLVEGRHYLPLNASYDAVMYRDCYDEAAGHLCERYSFRKFLSEI